MRRYYFDLRDGEELAPDEEGLELNSVQAVEMEAAKSVADMVRDAVCQSPPVYNRRMAIVVRDDKGLVMQLKFTFEIEKKLQ